MDLKQLEYIIKIAEENNITKAAEKLFITQSALNQQLIKLEKELGTQLFIRSRTNCQLTETGKIYLENAKKILQIKKDTYNTINDMIELRKGKLTIGLTPERGTEMFSAIYPLYYKKYPHIKIEPIEMTVKQQQEEIVQGNLDFGFVTLQDSQKTKDEYLPICSEKIILGVPTSHPLAHLGGTLGEVIPQISLQHFEGDSFALMQKGSTLREISDQLISEEDITPSILLETRSCRSLVSMVAEGICCSIFPISYAVDHPNLRYFTIKQNPIWEIAVSYKKGSYLRRAAKDFVELAAGYLSKKATY